MKSKQTTDGREAVELRTAAAAAAIREADDKFKPAAADRQTGT